MRVVPLMSCVVSFVLVVCGSAVCGPAVAQVISGAGQASSEASSPATGFAAPTDARCHSASLEELRDMGCRLEQAGCLGLREYQRETLDAMETRRAEGRASELDDELNPRMKAYLEQILRSKGC